MLIKVAVPNQIQLKVVPGFSNFLFGKQNEVHYIGGAEVLPAPLEPEAEANAIGISKSHDTYTEQMYIVTGVVCQIVSDADGDLYIRDADGNRLHVRGIFGSDGTAYDAMFPQPDLGDTITLMGVLGQYHGDPHMKNATIQMFNPEGPAPTGDAMVLALCSLLASTGMLAILPKKREY